MQFFEIFSLTKVEMSDKLTFCKVDNDYGVMSW